MINVPVLLFYFIARYTWPKLNLQKILTTGRVFTR